MKDSECLFSHYLWSLSGAGGSKHLSRCLSSWKLGPRVKIRKWKLAQICDSHGAAMACQMARKVSIFQKHSTASFNVISLKVRAAYHSSCGFIALSEIGASTGTIDKWDQRFLSSINERLTVVFSLFCPRWPKPKVQIFHFLI